MNEEDGFSSADRRGEIARAKRETIEPANKPIIHEMVDDYKWLLLYSEPSDEIFIGVRAWLDNDHESWAWFEKGRDMYRIDADITHWGKTPKRQISTSLFEVITLKGDEND